MSFDISLEQTECTHCDRGPDTVRDFSLTHNVNGIVDACLKASGDHRAKTTWQHYADWSWGRLDGWTAADAVPVLDAALIESRRPERLAEFRAMQPRNGWGRLVDVQEVLGEILTACRDYPAATIRVSG